MPPPLVFLHVPKAGGSTLLHVLEQQVAADELWACYGTDYADNRPALRRWHALPARRRARTRLVVGHFGYGLHAGLPAGTGYVTFLRDPEARVVSNYLDMRANPRVPLHRELRHTDLEAYLAHGLWHDADNGQVRRLCGLERDGRRVPFGGVTRAMLERAWEALERDFLAVGTVEAFDRSLLLLQRRFGWADVRYELQNARPPGERSEPSARARELLAAHNALDAELVARARERLERDAARVGVGTAEVEAFRRANAEASRLERLARLGRARWRRLRRALGA